MGLVNPTAGGGGVVAAANFTVVGGVVTLVKAFNVASIVRTGAGLFTVNFARDLASANYAFSAGGKFEDFGNSATVYSGPDRNTNGPHNRKTVALCDFITGDQNGIFDVPEGWLSCIDIDALN